MKTNANIVACLVGTAGLALLAGCAQPEHVDWSPLTSGPMPVIDAVALAQATPLFTFKPRPERVAPILDGSAAAQCEAAIADAEANVGTSPGLLVAIGKVESGRMDPRTHGIRPWPWAINVEGASYYFAAKPAAMAAVSQALARGVQSIDVGCMQVNLQQHATAFRNLSDAFDPRINANYAAQFLRTLWAATPTRDWNIAAGYYHSKTLTLASSYRQHVQAMLAPGTAIGGSAARPPASVSQLLRAADPLQRPADPLRVAGILTSDENAPPLAFTQRAPAQVASAP